MSATMPGGIVPVVVVFRLSKCVITCTSVWLHWIYLIWSDFIKGRILCKISVFHSSSPESQLLLKGLDLFFGLQNSQFCALRRNVHRVLNFTHIYKVCQRKYKIQICETPKEYWVVFFFRTETCWLNPKVQNPQSELFPLIGSVPLCDPMVL